mmetsp:Transcript_22443/g.44820  ORF Transcript_22443/g.44820 Transcript_22443/m.44820 type:complete len:235 (-) Transcript_22443:468-1172(-)
MFSFTVVLVDALLRVKEGPVVVFVVLPFIWVQGSLISPPVFGGVGERAGAAPSRSARVFFVVLRSVPIPVPVPVPVSIPIILLSVAAAVVSTVPLVFVVIIEISALFGSTSVRSILIAAVPFLLSPTPGLPPRQLRGSRAWGSRARVAGGGTAVLIIREAPARRSVVRVLRVVVHGRARAPRGGGAPRRHGAEGGGLRPGVAGGGSRAARGGLFFVTVSVVVGVAIAGLAVQVQ